MSTISDGTGHAGVLLTGAERLTREDLIRLNNLVEAFEQGVVSALEVIGKSFDDAMDLITSRRAA